MRLPDICPSSSLSLHLIVLLGCRPQFTLWINKMIPRAETQRSRFNLWVPTKAVSENPTGPPAGSGTSGSPTSGSSAPESRRSRIRVRLSRSGSRILLLLGLRGSKSEKGSDIDTDSSNSIQTGVKSTQSSPPSPDGNRDGSPEYLTTAESPQSEPLPVTPSFNTLNETAESLSEPLPILQPLSEVPADPTTEDTLQQNTTSESQAPPLTGQTSPINSKFVDRFSHKISLAFGQPTVIRRTNLRSRPSILRGNLPGEDRGNQADGADESSSPSTSPSGSGSPIGRHSTPLETSISSPSSDKSKTSDEQKQFTAVTTWPSIPEVIENDADHPLDTKDETVAPSIKTVEATAVAKVYLELHFNSIFNDEDSRQQRQLELQRQLRSFELTPEECLLTMHNWLLRENDHLRQCRVLRSNRKRAQSEETISRAGYKSIKLLGKGSFGVVRLVRKVDGVPSVTEDDNCSHANGATSANSRYRSLGILKNAVEGARQTRRRYMTGEKKEFYAMKVIKKAGMIRNSQEGHIRAERDFLVASESSRWVVPLIASFQDTNNLYLVMDYMVGGDFLSFLVRKDTLREDWARFYVAEMVLCIEEAHRLFWIHRDVKPDNFLISASGHLKISDFGLSFNGHWSHDQDYYNVHRYSLLQKLGIEVKGDAEDQRLASTPKDIFENNLPSMYDEASLEPPNADLLDWRENYGRRRFAKSVVGTSQYMAPEVIRGEMYDGRCDWWSLGIILYECLYGFTPFGCESRHDTKAKILEHADHLKFPRERSSDKMISADALDLILRILTERESRLCSPKYRANDILIGRQVSKHFLYSMDTRYKNVASYYVYANDATDIKIHPFFRGIRWQDLHMCQPPMVPRVRSWQDTRYFDEWKLADKAEDVASDSEEKACHLDKQSGYASINPPDPTGNALPESQAVKATPNPAPGQANSVRKKEKKRPRDKILRDEELSKTVLDIRKAGAFLGYTYRRPNEVALAFGSERGRQRAPRGDLTSLFAT
ncbi:unnamed protein product [Penicillium olsonii]|uniref:non-specific serine/threonine protein kinase n=1 Tax=Penicillium olsonii TaxID=99116 RepID=A0A9W4MWT9_PENOL|nr:unnamed protein product [Penicillium olsonii]